MATKVLGATPTVIDTLKKAKDLVNRQSVAVDQSPVKNRTSVSVSTNNAGKAVPARILSGNGSSGYTADIFGEGLENPPTARGTVFLANGRSTLWELPPGTILYVQKAFIDVMGNGDY
jgi:hypothetical protein